MAKISKEAVRAAYDVAKRIRAGELSGPQGLAIPENEYGFNRNSKLWPYRSKEILKLFTFEALAYQARLVC